MNEDSLCRLFLDCRVISVPNAPMPEHHLFRQLQVYIDAQPNIMVVPTTCCYLLLETLTWFCRFLLCSYGLSILNTWLHCQIFEVVASLGEPDNYERNFFSYLVINRRLLYSLGPLTSEVLIRSWRMLSKSTREYSWRIFSKDISTSAC